jgi:hypothetical protein
MTMEFDGYVPSGDRWTIHGLTIQLIQLPVVFSSCYVMLCYVMLCYVMLWWARQVNLSVLCLTYQVLHDCVVDLFCA